MADYHRRVHPFLVIRRRRFPRLTPNLRKLKIMKTKIDHSARLTAALTAASVRTFRCESSYPEFDASRNLQGRTHYADEDALKAFKAKILNAGCTKDGLLYWLVESVQSRPNHGGYTRRAVVFDVFGTIVNERPDFRETQGEWFKDTRKAENAAFEFMESFDAVKHTTKTLKENAKRDIETARRTLAALAGRSEA